jgi:hypothetical protein
MGDTTEPVPLPLSINIEPRLGNALVCAEHNSTFTKSSIGRHLTKDHGKRGKEKARVMEWLSAPGRTIAANSSDITIPADGGSRIEGLQVLKGYLCTAASSCRMVTKNEEIIKQHCTISHSWQRRKDRIGPYKQVWMQTPWTKKNLIKYFVIQLRQEVAGNEDVPPPALLDQVASRYEAAQCSAAARYHTMQRPQHPSELTPWLRMTGYVAHTIGVEIDEIPLSYAIPAPKDDLMLAVICAAVKRALFNIMELIEGDDSEEKQLSKLIARLLNTFRRAEISQDPFQPLQNQRSKENYIRVFQQLCCYFSRVNDQTYLTQKTMFKATDAQMECWSAITRLAALEMARIQRFGEKQWLQQLAQVDGERAAELEQSVIAFYISLLQQKLTTRSFDSPLVSFTAAISWDAARKTWIDPTNATSPLSTLIYNFQLVVLKHCMLVAEQDTTADLNDHLTRFRDKWMLNDTPGPASELLSNRLYGVGTSKATVGAAKIRWSADGQTIHHLDVQLHMQDLRGLFQHEIRAARRIFKEDLCFGLDNIPTFPIKKLVDNWDASSPGLSFLTDQRNSSILGEGTDWLRESVLKRPDLARLIIRKTGDNGEWCISSEAARQYEDSVQHFLEHMLVLMHMGSGQPGRRPEFLGMRWCNVQADKRNIYIHDGYVLYLITYHKMLSNTNASKYPVRLLMPDVGELLVQFLTITLKFRRWLSGETSIPERINEALFSRGAEIWTEERMTQIVQLHTQAAIGIQLHVRSWRQIAAGIGIKKLVGGMETEQLLACIKEDGDDPELEIYDAMPDSVHLQGARSANVGNRVYGGTINFNHGLTDVGLQEFRRLSLLWHALFLHAGGRSRQRTHTRQRSDTAPLVSQPLTKRIAFRAPALRHRTSWTRAEVDYALRGLYGPRAAFKTPEQEQGMLAVTGGEQDVVLVLATGEGKSLSYLLTQRLPGAGTTVLVLPLLSLKQDTIRRCRQLVSDCIVWSGKAPYGMCNSLVIVSIDQAVGDSFHTYLNQLNAAGQLTSIVFDECHLILTAASYRRRMERVADLRNLKCQFVFLTATLPPCLVDAFNQKLHLWRPCLVRSLTIRKDLQYVVEECPSKDFLQAAMGRVHALLEEGWFANEADARAIIYTRSKDQADEIGEKLQCPVYHSESGSEEEKAEVLGGWIDGDCRLLAATTAFGAGIDYPSVRAVIHIDIPHGAIDFVQEVGRAGRDGSGGVSCVLVPENWRRQAQYQYGEYSPANIQTMLQFLDGTRCRLLPLSGYLDGVVQSCKSIDVACDQCFQLGLLPAEKIESGVYLHKKEELEVDTLEYTGPKLLRSHNQDEAVKLQAFVRRLELIDGICLVCVVGDGKPIDEHSRHELRKCNSRLRHRFFAAKSKAINEGEESGNGWLAKLSCCFTCGLGQMICDKQGQKGCRFRDIAMPGCWGVFQRAEWQQYLAGITKQRSPSEEKYMAWLGKEREVYGFQGNNFTYLIDIILRNLLEG